MIGVHQNLNSSRDLTTSLSGMICCPRAKTCYDQHAYQMWSLQLHQRRKYEKGYTMWKMGGLWNLGSLKVTEHGVIRYSTYEVLLAV